MENKNEKSMTLEEMISEMLKDAKVVKVPLPARAEEKTEAQKQDKPMPAHPQGNWSGREDHSGSSEGTGRLSG